MALGDHICVRRARGLYWHHGIDLGNERVVHFSGEPFRMRDAVVQEISREAFLQGAPARLVPYSAGMRSPEEVVRIARSLIGHTGYDLLLNNCEHFARYCKTGQHASQQVSKALVTVGVTAAGVLLTGGVLLTRSLIRSRMQRSA